MFTFVCWKWDDPQGKRQFPSEYVNILRAMLERHYHKPHRLVCITENPAGLDGRIRTYHPPVKFANLKNPHGDRYPSCYRRLWNFSREAGDILGRRFMAIDIDVIITGDITDLIDRHTEPFVGWTDPSFRWDKIAGGIYLMDAGCHPEVWEDFDPLTSPQVSKDAGCFGSDQGWISYKLFPPEGTFTREEGVWSMKWIPRRTRTLPEGVRIISTPGDTKPWSPHFLLRSPWAREHWRL